MNKMQERIATVRKAVNFEKTQTRNPYPFQLLDLHDVGCGVYVKRSHL